MLGVLGVLGALSALCVLGARSVFGVRHVLGAQGVLCAVGVRGVLNALVDCRSLLARFGAYTACWARSAFKVNSVCGVCAGCAR